MLSKISDKDLYIKHLEDENKYLRTLVDRFLEKSGMAPVDEDRKITQAADDILRKAEDKSSTAEQYGGD